MKKIMYFFVTLLLILATESSVLGKSEMRCSYAFPVFYFKHNSTEINILRNKNLESDLNVWKQYYSDLQSIDPRWQGFLLGFLYVQGHCNDGEDKSIALKRAKKIKQILVKAGFLPCHIGIISFKNSQPQVPNDSKENRAINRRVEIIFMNKAIYKRAFHKIKFNYQDSLLQKNELDSLVKTIQKFKILYPAMNLSVQFSHQFKSIEDIGYINCEYVSFKKQYEKIGDSLLQKNKEVMLRRREEVRGKIEYLMEIKSTFISNHFDFNEKYEPSFVEFLFFPSECED